MTQYGEIRRALALQPTSWSLDEQVRDDQEVEDFPVTDLDVKSMSEAVTPAATLRRAAMEASLGNPQLLRSAIEQGLIKPRDAARRVRRYWGPDIEPDDFEIPR